MNYQNFIHLDSLLTYPLEASPAMKPATNFIPFCTTNLPSHLNLNELDGKHDLKAA